MGVIGGILHTELWECRRSNSVKDNFKGKDSFNFPEGAVEGQSVKDLITS